MSSLLISLLLVPIVLFAGESRLRDPFRPSVLEVSIKKARIGLEAAAVEEFRLVGIVWGTKQPRAMVEDKAGIGYILQRGMTVGADGGLVKEIQRDKVVIEENPTNRQALSPGREFILTLGHP